MPYLDVVLPFLSVFLGAFLAVRLESFRIRRSARAWARQHLSHLGPTLADDLAVSHQVDEVLQQQVDACTAWVEATPETALTEEQWSAITFTLGASPPDFGAVLRSEAVTALPSGLTLTLAQTEASGRRAQFQIGAVREAQSDVLPLWFDRKVPLTPSEQRRVQRLREAVEAAAAQVRAVRTPLGDLVAQIDAFLR